MGKNTAFGEIPSECVEMGLGGRNLCKITGSQYSDSFGDCFEDKRRAPAKNRGSSFVLIL